MRKIILLSIGVFFWIVTLLSIMIYFGSNLESIDLAFYQVVFTVIGLIFYLAILILPFLFFVLWLEKKRR